MYFEKNTLYYTLLFIQSLCNFFSPKSTKKNCVYPTKKKGDIFIKLVSFPFLNHCQKKKMFCLLFSHQRATQLFLFWIIFFSCITNLLEKGQNLQRREAGFFCTCPFFCVNCTHWSLCLGVAEESLLDKKKKKRKTKEKYRKTKRRNQGRKENVRTTGSRRMTTLRRKCW